MRLNFPALFVLAFSVLLLLSGQTHAQPQDTDKEKRAAEIKKEIAELQAKIARLQDELAKFEPKSADPISVRFTAKKATYVLDRQGMTAEKYREAIREGKIVPPALDLALEITNTTKGDIDITIAGVSPRLTLELKGQKGIEKRTVTRPRNPTVRIILKPGQTFPLPITRLAVYSGLTTDDQLFWTEPGEYTLAASFETNIRKPGTNEFISTRKAYASAPLKLSVTLK